MGQRWERNVLHVPAAVTVVSLIFKTLTIFSDGATAPLPPTVSSGLRFEEGGDDTTTDTAVITPPTPPTPPPTPIVSSDFRFEDGGVRMPPSSGSMMPIGAGDASSSPMRASASICSILMLTKSCTERRSKRMV
uniref:Uncharacterized protein n=1 Tax=Anopheles maculatus TaxID=74869 RepID=A0A182TAL4_9DIPT